MSLSGWFEQFSAQRREGIKVLFEYFQPAVLSYDEVSDELIVEFRFVT